MSELRVGDQYRTNKMSLVPGGKTVKVTYDTGKSYIYDKVKKPGPYIKKISDDEKNGEIVEIRVDGNVVWTSLSKIKPWDI